MSDKKPKPQEEKDPKETIQKYILEGRKVLIKKENETTKHR
jgi:hypothetical protein